MSNVCCVNFSKSESKPEKKPSDYIHIIVPERVDYNGVNDTTRVTWQIAWHPVTGAYMLDWRVTLVNTIY